MSSAYGKIDRSHSATTSDAVDKLLPLRFTLKNGREIKIIRYLDAHISQLHELLNAEINAGNTYPQENILNDLEFKNYFLCYDCFVAVYDGDGSIVLGSFYVKPNFPGRCSHICNGGFITNKNFRNLGIGKKMAEAYLEIAPKLGYSASMFNLVFVSNEASCKIWSSLGFKEIGRVPKAGRLKGEQEKVDAIMFYYDFTLS